MQFGSWISDFVNTCLEVSPEVSLEVVSQRASRQSESGKEPERPPGALVTHQLDHGTVLNEHSGLQEYLLYCVQYPLLCYVRTKNRDLRRRKNRGKRCRSPGKKKKQAVAELRRRRRLRGRKVLNTNSGHNRP